MCFLKINILCWTSRSWKGCKTKWNNRDFFAPNTQATSNRSNSALKRACLLLCQSCIVDAFDLTFLWLLWDLFLSSLCENKAFLLFFSFPLCVPNHLAVLASLYIQGLIVFWTSLVATVTRSNTVSDDCCVGCLVTDLGLLRQPVHWVVQKMVSPHCLHWSSVLRAFPKEVTFAVDCRGSRTKRESRSSWVTWTSRTARTPWINGTYGPISRHITY